MEELSFYLRAGLWVAAGILLINALFVRHDIADFAFFVLMATVALAYTWVDNTMFGTPIIFDHAHLPHPTIRHLNSEQHLYQVRRDTYYHTDTPSALVDVLEDAIQNERTVRIYYGTPTTGAIDRAVVGTISRSPGSVQIPVVVGPASPTGEPLLDHLIVKMDDLASGNVLYWHKADS